MDCYCGLVPFYSTIGFDFYDFAESFLLFFKLEGITSVYCNSFFFLLIYANLI